MKAEADGHLPATFAGHRPRGKTPVAEARTALVEVSPASGMQCGRFVHSRRSRLRLYFLSGHIAAFDPPDPQIFRNQRFATFLKFRAPVSSFS